jgi:hypothetical protein
LKPYIRWTKAVAAHFGFKVVWINRLGQKAERLSGRADVELNILRGYRHCSCSLQFRTVRYLQFNRPNA